MKQEITNRYGDVFTFEYNERGNIQWSGNFEFHRFRFNEDQNDITMVDPSGGPYITEGMDMKMFGLKGKVIGFIRNEDGYEIVIDKNKYLQQLADQAQQLNLGYNTNNDEEI